MINHLWVCVKIGDQVGDDKLTIKHGMIIDFIEPQDANYGEDWSPPESSSKVFLWLKMHVSKKSQLTEWVKSDLTKGRARKKLLKISSLPKKLKDKIENSEYAHKVLDLTQDDVYLLEKSKKEKIKNLKTIDVEKLFADTDILEDEFKDKNAISSGSYNIGSGETYVTRAQFCADLTSLTGDITGTFTSATIETAQSILTVALNSYTLKLTSNSNHLGNPNAGHLINENFQVSNDGALKITNISGGGTIEIEKLNSKFTYGSLSSVKLIQADSSFAFTLKIHDCILNADDKTWRCIEISDTDIICQLYNLKVFGSSLDAILMIGSSSSIIENVTVHSSAIGINVNNTACTLRNVVAHNNTTNYTTVGNATGYNCATTDASAIGFSAESDTVNNISDSDFLNITNTQKDYLDIGTNSRLYRAGSDGSISGHIAGINNVVWSTTKWDIGAFAVRSASPGALTFGARITLTDKNNPIGENPEIGLYSVPSNNSEIRWIMNIVQDLSEDWKEGFILPDGIPNIRRYADIQKGGNTSDIGGGSLVVKNTDKLWLAFKNLGINLQGKKIEIVYFLGTTEYVQYTGICRNPSWTAQRYVIPYESSLNKRKALISEEINVEGTTDKAFVPITFGEWSDSQAQLNQTRKIEVIQTGADIAKNATTSTFNPNMVPENVTSFPVLSRDSGNTTKEFYFRVGESGDFNKTNDTWSPDDIYVKVLTDPNSDSLEGVYRKVSSISLYSAVDERGTIFDCIVDEHFPAVLTGDDGGEGAWVQIIQIDKTYKLDQWPCIGFLSSDGSALSINPEVYIYDTDKSVSVSGNKETTSIDEEPEDFILLPQNSIVNTVDANKASTIIRPSLFSGSTDKISSFYFFPIDTSTFELFDKDTLDGFTIDTHDGANFEKVSDGLFLDNTIGTTGVVLSVPDFESAKLNLSNREHALSNSPTFAVAYTGSSARRTAVVLKFRLPTLPGTFKFNKTYIITTAQISIGVVGANIQTKFVNHIFVKRWLGTASAIVDASKSLFNNLGSTFTDLTCRITCVPDFYVTDQTDENESFYVESTSLPTIDLNGYTNFESESTSNINDYQTYQDGFLIWYSDITATNWITRPRVGEIVLMFERINSIKKKLFTFFQGRIFDDTWGSRKTSTSLIEGPIDILEHACRLQNWSDFTDSIPTGGWGKSYSSGAQVLTGTSTGSFDAAPISLINNTFKCAGQIRIKGNASTDKVKKSICRDFFLLNYVDRDGKENVVSIAKKPFQTPSNIITFADIRKTSSTITVREPNVSDVFCEPFVEYNINTGDNTYKSIIAIHNASAPSYDSSDPDNYGWVEYPEDAMTEGEAEAYWLYCHELWERVGQIQTPPSDLTQVFWANGNTENAHAIAVNKLTNWIDWMWNRTVSFSVHFNHESNGIKTRNLYEGSRFMLQLPHHTNNAQIECIITSLNIETKAPYHITIEAILLDSDEVFDPFYYQDVMFTKAEGASDDWQDTTDQNNTEYQKVV